MKEYVSVPFSFKPNSKNQKRNSEKLDELLNKYAQAGWKLHSQTCVSGLDDWGYIEMLFIFEADSDSLEGK